MYEGQKYHVRRIYEGKKGRRLQIIKTQNDPLSEKIVIP